MQFKLSLWVSMFFLLISFNSYSQNIYNDYQDGKIYLKIRNESDLVFRSLDEVNTNKNHKELSYIFNQYQITSVERPFIRLKTPIFDRTYEIVFQNPSDVDLLMRDLNRLEYIEYAERVELLRTTLTPNDPGVGQQYHLTNIQAYDAWDIHTGGNAIVAIVDDAVRITHTDIAPNVWINTGEIANNGVDDDNNGYIDDVNGFDVADNDGNPNPPATASDFSFSHGTHCAGIASGATNNGTGIASIGFSNKIMAVKSTSDAGNPQFVENGYQGVSYAITAGADVISMSWGGSGSSTTAQNIFNQAHNAGITLVGAAGNDNVSTVFYPAGYNFVISVASTNQNDQKSSFSNFGSWIDVSAPGSSILSTVATSTTSYQSYDGTSMACPMVAGLCGLLKSYDGSLSPDNIEFCITNSADNIDAQNPSYISQLGAGRINAFTTLQCGNPTNPPVADFNISQQGELCAGATLQFSDVSIFNPTAWSWSFPGGTPSSSTLQNPTVTYNTLGTFDVTLTVTNQYGNDTKTQTGYVTIGLNGIEEFFLEDFESGLANWTFDNADNGVTWTSWTVGGTENGANAAGIDNYNYNAPGQKDAIISPILDFSGRSNISLEFDYAHRRYSADYADSLNVYISNNGGLNFTPIFQQAEDGTGVFATNTTTTAQFIPSSIDDWCYGGQVGASCPSFDLSAYDGLSNIVLKFENVNDYGNNTYLDNISLKSSCFIPPGPPTADFIADVTSGCQGTVVQYTNLSYGNPDPTSWSWSFPGGTPTTSTLQNPTVTYNTSGAFDVTLITTNAGGSDTKTDNGYVVIDQNATHTFYLEDFEGATTDWAVNNPDNGIGFEKTNVGGTISGTSAYYINHYEYSTLGQLDEMVSPLLDFTGKENVSLDLDYAYAKYNNNYTDAFNIYISNNGGTTYNQIFSGSDDGSGNFATREATTLNFIPTLTSDWCYFGNYGASCINLDLSAYDNQSNIRIKFETVNGYSNNLYLDNIQLSTTCQGSQIVLPTAAFSADITEGCAPLAVSFSDQSSGTPDTWSWVVSGPNNFSSNDQNPNFTFNTAGTYNVSLVVTNAAGNNTTVQNNYITVYPTSVAGFTYVDNNGVANFTNTSTTTGNATYSWNFGDGGSSTAMNPFHAYAQSGTYTVILTVTDDCGTDVYTENITVNIDTSIAPTATFSADTNTGCVPFTVNFTDQSSGAPTSWSWVISGPENLSSSSQNPNFTFNTPGNYNVSLVVSNAVGNNASVQNNFIIASPDSDASFTFNENNGLVNFTNTSTTTGNVSYAWNFGDNNTSTQTNPIHTYSQNGTYTVTLTITDDCGTNSFSQNVNITIDNTVAPTAAFSANITTGCVPFTVNFTDQSSGAPTSWAWTVSGSDNLSSNVQDPSFTFTTEGSYNVTLTVNNAAGNNTAQINNYIIASPASFADFTYFDDNGEVSFTNTSSTTGNVTYVWDFGDSSTSNMENPTHNFVNGIYNVSLTITDDCGTESFSQSIEVIILGLEDLEGINNWNVFPNPNDGLFNVSIDGNSNENMTIEIMDLLGRKLLTHSLDNNSGNNIIPIDVRHLSKGTYFIRLSDGNGQDVKKVIIH